MDEMKKSDIIGGIVLLSMWTVMIFLLGSIWQLEQDLKQISYEYKEKGYDRSDTMGSSYGRYDSITHCNRGVKRTK